MQWHELGVMEVVTEVMGKAGISTDTVWNNGGWHIIVKSKTVDKAEKGFEEVGEGQVITGLQDGAPKAGCCKILVAAADVEPLVKEVVTHLRMVEEGALACQILSQGRHGGGLCLVGGA